ncbi:glycerol-3-phosphate dehydrogenase/oxidase [Tumebacillus sp. DT12]|uniref:Aerobic glycerol-3-phosphate dehydrogenase n=1 Tax=Tumebacillus lacus TaxID=2995335 RepID=A0ABT3X2G4_9BACL|nr:glycerol-3-phosphate dehydrogenase/oxidase [Tumebacillus lacus]MCX7571110.1 glycerol-3-phosphate dehydrogenase/oxidase [Tumebacillus lacus]
MAQQSGWMGHPRSHWRAQLEQETFDLIVIGGGITGAGIAREASLAGLKTAVLEASDFASGTSSRSTKLIHGGLRYLAQGHVRLVREAGSERAVLRRLAPHLVEPKPFLLPIYKGMQHGLIAMSFAVWLYDRLAGVDRSERRRVLNAKALLARHPDLAASGLRGGVLYHEYVTDDARLTLATLQSATEQGAVVLNAAKVEGLLTEQGKTCGVWAVDGVTGESFLVRGQVVVNAAGPWIEDVLGLEASETRTAPSPSRVTHSRGIHLSFAADRLPLPHALAVQTRDGRLVFLIPKRDVTYVGTTDKRYDGDLLHPTAPDDEIAYLLDIANGLLPDAQLTESDIVGVWSGVRPLVQSGKGNDGQDTKDVSREDEIWVSEHGLITIAGGKLTAYRKMAERILTHVRAALPAGTGDWARREQLSHALPLYGAAAIPATDSDGWLRREAARLCDLHPLLTESNALTLLYRYGDQAASVLASAPPDLECPAAPILPGIPLLEAEIPHMIGRESALRLVDLIARRTELGRFRGRELSDLLNAVADRMQRTLGWSDAKRADEIAICRRDCHLTY